MKRLSWFHRLPTYNNTAVPLTEGREGPRTASPLRVAVCSVLILGIYLSSELFISRHGFAPGFWLILIISHKVSNSNRIFLTPCVIRRTWNHLPCL